MHVVRFHFISRCLHPCKLMGYRQVVGETDKMLVARVAKMLLTVETGDKRDQCRPFGLRTLLQRLSLVQRPVR